MLANTITTKNIKSGLLVFLISFLVALISFFAVTGKVLSVKYKSFLSEANLSHKKFLNIIKTGLENKKFENKEQLNFLVMGLDQVANRGESTSLTDTMMLASINLKSGKMTTLSLPRDLWSAPYKTKINALYVYGQERNPENPAKFPQKTIEEMTGIKIDYTLVTTLNQISQLIDIVGGIKVDVTQAFTDEKFPRSDVDVTRVTDPALLYETVKFEQGCQIMNGDRALKYIRSRMSQDEEGNDLAREKRQQQVITGLVDRLTNYQLYWQRPYIAGKLFNFYQQNFASHLPVDDLIGLSKNLVPVASEFKLNANTLSVYPDDKSGVIIHPDPSEYNGQWIYEIKNQEAFQKEIQDKLNIN